jgi:L-alanine-DL-glutamate epimerase-like enolase superfamily enzyme
MNRRKIPLFYVDPPEPSGDGADTPPQGGGTTPPADPPKADEGKTFTQADVDRIIAGRLSKFADYDEVKTKLSKIEDANATETEKAIKAAREEARIETLRESAPERVRLAFEAAAGQRMTAAQIEELLEDVDTTKYLTDTGAIDRDRVAKKMRWLAG